VFPQVKDIHCPAEFLNAIFWEALHTRGIGFGNFLFGDRTEEQDADGNTKVVLKSKMPWDPFRLTFPRLQYSTEQVIG